jgi:hypothetical protein
VAPIALVILWLGGESRGGTALTGARSRLRRVGYEHHDLFANPRGQRADRGVVVPAVAGSNPVAHPSRRLRTAGLLASVRGSGDQLHSLPSSSSISFDTARNDSL